MAALQRSRRSFLPHDESAREHWVIPGPGDRGSSLPPRPSRGYRWSSAARIGQRDQDQCPSPLTGLAERFRSYWGIPPGRIAAVAELAEDFRADAVVVVGLDVLPYLGAVRGPKRIWYAGDEWVWHHLSQVSLGDRSSWSNLRDAAVKGLYEYAYAPLSGSRLGRLRVGRPGDAPGDRPGQGGRGAQRRGQRVLQPAQRRPRPITVASSGAAWTSARTCRRSSGFAAGCGQP